MTTPKIKSLLDSVERVDITTLKTHPRNPRKGDVSRIAQSLEANAQYRPIVVQKKTGYIIAGNHTFLGAKQLGWTHLDVVQVDVSDKQARKIMLADNRTSDAGTYDDAILAEVLQSLEGDRSGTGYYDDEIEAIISGAQQAAEDAIVEFQDTEAQRRFNDAPLGEETEEDLKSFTGEGNGGNFSDDGGDMLDRPMPLAGGAATDDEDGGLEAAKDQLTGFKKLPSPEETEFPKIGYWEVPELDQSMLMRFDEIPEKFYAWGESYSRDGLDPAVNDPETWYLLNWGMSSSKGIPNLKQTIVGFYSPDNVFENWWSYPERYASKLVNSGVKYILGPDFSILGEDPRTIWLWQIYRQRWLSRYIQEAGVKVCPNVSGPYTDLKFFRDYVLATLPVGLPLVSCQFQTFSKEDVEALGEKTYADYYQMIFDVLQPQGFLLYAGKPGQEFFAKHVKPNCPVRVIDSRLTRLGELDKMFPKSRARKQTI